MTTIPEDYKDLLERPIVVTLTTIMPDGSPQASPVWFNYDGSHILINTTRGRQKDANMTERPVHESDPRYTGNPDFYSRAESRRGKEQRVIYKIKPTHVVAH